MANEPSPFDPLWMSVASPLRQAILEGALPSGTLLSENRLAAEYGVSRTPVREALRLLMDEELVEMLPGRKMRVVAPQAETVREIYDVRWVIEAEAVRRMVRDACADGLLAIMAHACEQADDALRRQDLTSLARANEEFHATLVSAVRNSRLIAQYRAVRNLVTLYRHQSLNSESWAGDSTAEHRPFLECLVRRDDDGALALLRTHIERAREVVIRRIETRDRKARAA